MSELSTDQIRRTLTAHIHSSTNTSTGILFSGPSTFLRDTRILVKSRDCCKYQIGNLPPRNVLPCCEVGQDQKAVEEQ